MTACYFAAKSALRRDSERGEFALWITHASYLENVGIEVKDHPRAPYRIEVIVAPYSGNPNLRSQKGCFTNVRLNDYQNLQEIDRISILDAFHKICLHRHKTNGVIFGRIKDEPHLAFRKLTLPVSEAAPLLDHLSMIGINAAYLFPGLSGCKNAVEDMILISSKRQIP